MQDMPENEAIKVMRDSCGSVCTAELNIHFRPVQAKIFYIYVSMKAYVSFIFQLTGFYIIM